MPVAEPKIYRETSIIVQKEPEEVPCIVEKPVVVEVKLPPEIIHVDKFKDNIVERIVEVPKVVKVDVIKELIVESIKHVGY